MSQGKKYTRRFKAIISTSLLVAGLSTCPARAAKLAPDFVPPENKIKEPFNDETCLANCHGKKDFGADFKESAARDLFIPPDFKSSTHASEGIACIDCHADADPNFHPEGGFKKVDCNECHEGYGKISSLGGALARFRISAHGKGDLSISFREAQCPYCHYAEIAHGGGKDKPCPKCHRRQGANVGGLTAFHIKPDSAQPWSTAARWAYEGIFWLCLLAAAGLKIKTAIAKKRKEKSQTAD